MAVYIHDLAKHAEAIFKYTVDVYLMTAIMPKHIVHVRK
jgi:hypothetical protein